MVNVGLTTARSWVRLPAVPLPDIHPGQVVHTHAFVTEQYNFGTGLTTDKMFQYLLLTESAQF